MVGITVPITIEISNQFIEDLLVTCFEGGSNYWVSSVEILHPKGAKPRGVASAVWAAEALNLGGTLDFMSDGEVFTLTKDMLLEGIKLWVQNLPSRVESLLNGDIDAGEADSILQYGLFKKLEYG